MNRIVKVDRDRFGPWAIVTGASAGIGREFARQLAASGLNLVLVARRLEALERIGHDLAGEYGVEYRAVGLDLSHEGFIDRLDRSTADLDIGLVVSNAGAIQIAELLDHDREHLHRMVRLNAVGVGCCSCRASAVVRACPGQPSTAPARRSRSSSARVSTLSSPGWA